MTKKDNLISLRDAVKAGPYETMGHARRCQKAFPAPKPSEQMTREDYANSIAQMVILAWRNHSLDAALKFKDAVLPDWEWIVGFAGGECRALVAHSEDMGDPMEYVLTDNPATALILACLEALIAQTAEGETDE